MSKFRESYASAKSVGRAEGEAFDALAAECPDLALVMAGEYDEGGNCLVPSCTLMLFLEAGRVKFCLSPKFGPQVAFGTLPDPSKGLQGVDEEIREGRFEWKSRGNKRG